ncbi:hypothetical protein Lal_00028399 [Lupinus albus]|nr:hypothetical protein Lal_00028399 [Lupinus albus]
MRQNDLLLANKEQRLVFQEHFLGRLLIDPKYGKHSPLPYAIIITTVLEHFGIATVGETNIEFDARDSKIDMDVFHKMGFFQDSIDLHFKHLNDQSTAHADVPTIDQPDPQPSPFNVESSSSSTMPINQMIMDDLFSLRDSEGHMVLVLLHCVSTIVLATHQ